MPTAKPNANAIAPQDRRSQDHGRTEQRLTYGALAHTSAPLEKSRLQSLGTMPNPEVVPPGPAPRQDPATQRPLRRTFTQQYKEAILAEAAQCNQPGQIGALLRREGLYSSHLVDWRRQQERQQAQLTGQTPPPVALAVQNKALRAKTKQLQKQLAQAQALLDLQKKVSQLLGITLETLESSEENS